MPIYDRPVKLLFREFITDTGLRPESVFARQEVVNWFSSKYPKIKPSTVAAHLTMMSVNAPTRVHYSYHSDPANDLFVQIDKSHFRLYQPSSDAPPLRKQARTTELADAGDEEQEDDGEGSKEFAYERDLKNYLARNLGKIETGLQLYEEEGITGIEFPAGNRFIDILATDRQNNYVVIELKVSKGYDRVIGQLLRYMAWIERNHAEPSQRVRGVIVGSHISEDLRLAATKIADVDLFEYELSLTLKKLPAERQRREM